MASGIIALDVGGTSIKAALVIGGQLNEQSVKVYPSRAKESMDVIVTHLLDIIKHQALTMQHPHSIVGVALAFPGPFDYVRGISLMKGIDKYDAIYGVNLREELRQKIEADSELSSRFYADLRIVFENDVRAFALGQLLSGQAAAYDRSLCLTIGTGLGSAFLDHGAIVTDHEAVPDGGWIFNQPFREGIVDDYISKRGILRIASELGYQLEGMDVKELANRSRQGDRAAGEVFERFGSVFAAAMNPYNEAFRPEALILGGQIAKSFDLSMDGFRRTASRQVEIVIVGNTSHSTFLGAASLLK
ncbi:ROK family protein [Paenibacillus apiarius]|uniref:ROK family protein n=1 Tax=Paenibacillus apiarius TaxID=46240 RepID=A0ABT4DY43_9BACL|nr:ROK family protein [Paenibacillus apiarius]MCY9517458.1 ROK family protein [Paenibacillus apiarius]MCY9522263.1 ROK family protein [Paenibacillus apiarius]MCY9552297.1 ROK family protein [Paenibacillus apiarius]MCY9560176.1 ROK family protein [Paenibacillus apiarius]MCY9683794.1 ROK family protein [Paenibacillus apiarius]